MHCLRYLINRITYMPRYTNMPNAICHMPNDVTYQLARSAVRFVLRQPEIRYASTLRYVQTTNVLRNCVKKNCLELFVCTL